MIIQFRRPSLAAPPFTWATKPTSYPIGQPVWISDAGVKGSEWIFDGTRWKPFNNQALLASLDTAVTGLTNSEVISFQYLLPATLLQLKDRLRLDISFSKSGTTDTGSLRWRLGPLGTTADPALSTASLMSAAQQSGGTIHEARIQAATTAQQLARNDLGFGGATSNGASSPLTISNISSALYSSVGLISSSTNNTVSLVDAQLWLIAPAN